MIIPQFQQTHQPDNNDETPTAEYSDFAQGILSGIPENDRPVVAKYIKDWDSNVTKKFQSIHDEYQPYKELGDLEDVQAALYYNSMLQNSPKEYLTAIKQAYEEAGMDINDILNSGDQEDSETPAQPQGIPKEYQQKMTQMETMIGNMYNQFQGYTQQQTEAQQIAELDKYMEGMHSKHGAFDDDWVLLQIEKGADPEKAIEQFKDKFSGYGSPRKPAPAILNGNGAVQRDQVVASKLSTPERKDWVKQILEANRD